MTTPTSPEVLKCTGTADFLAALPRLAGFTATNSLFVVFFDGSRASEAMRIDLPDSDAPHEVTPLLDFLVQTLEQLSLGLGSRVSPAVAIVTDRTFAECGGPPWLRLARRIERRLHRDRIALRELCVQAPDGWTGLLDPIASKRPKPLSDITGSAISARVAPGGEPIRPLEELGEVPVSAPELIASVAAALAAITGYPPAPISPDSCGRRGDGMGGRTTDDVLAAARLVQADDAPGANAIAEAVATIAHPMAWVLVALDLADCPELVENLAELAHSSCDHILPLIPRPAHVDEARPLPLAADVLALSALQFDDRGRLGGWRERLRWMLAATPEDSRTGLFCLSAYVWWMCGNQTVAFDHLARARELAPDDEIAAMLEGLVGKPLASQRLGRHHSGQTT